MSTRITLAEFLASMEQLEEDLDRSTRAIERCIHHLTDIQGHVRRDQLARSQMGWPRGTPGSTPTAPAAQPARDLDRRLRSG